MKGKKTLQHPKTNYVKCLHTKPLANMSIAMWSNIRQNVSLAYDLFTP